MKNLFKATTKTEATDTPLETAASAPYAEATIADALNEHKNRLGKVVQEQEYLCTLIAELVGTFKTAGLIRRDEDIWDGLSDFECSVNEIVEQAETALKAAEHAVESV